MVEDQTILEDDEQKQDKHLKFMINFGVNNYNQQVVQNLNKLQ